MRKLRKNQSIIWDISVEDFKKLVENSSSIGEILKYFKLTNKGGNSNTVKRRYANILHNFIVVCVVF